MTVADARGDVTIEEKPTRIISLSPSLTEILFEVGAGDQVVAVDEYSNYPPEAPTTDLSGFTPNVEAIADYEPDLVVLSGDSSDITEQLEKLHIPVLLLPAAEKLEDTFAQMELLGEATGNADEGIDAAEELRERMDAIVAEVVDDGAAGLSYYHEIDAQLYSVTSDTFIGQIYDRSAWSTSPTKQKTRGRLPATVRGVHRRTRPRPHLRLLPGRRGRRPGPSAFATVTAVQQKNVVEVDADISPGGGRGSPTSSRKWLRPSKRRAANDQ